MTQPAGSERMTETRQSGDLRNLQPCAVWGTPCPSAQPCPCRPELVEQRAAVLLRAHWGDTAWDGDVEAVKRLNPSLWALYMAEAQDAI
jgi:hypothetical protein